MLWAPVSGDGRGQPLLSARPCMPPQPSALPLGSLCRWYRLRVKPPSRFQFGGNRHLSPNSTFLPAAACAEARTGRCKAGRDGCVKCNPQGTRRVACLPAGPGPFKLLPLRGATQSMCSSVMFLCRCLKCRGRFVDGFEETYEVGACTPGLSRAGPVTSSWVIPAAASAGSNPPKCVQASACC